jgi:hypothetical protein
MLQSLVDENVDLYVEFSDVDLVDLDLSIYVVIVEFTVQI